MQEMMITVERERDEWKRKYIEISKENAKLKRKSTI